MRPAVGQIEHGFQKRIAGIAVRQDLLLVRVGFVFLVVARIAPINNDTGGLNALRQGS